MLKIICFSIRIKFLYGINHFAKTQGRSYGGYDWGAVPPKQNFEAKVLNFAVLSFGPRILSFSFKF